MADKDEKTQFLTTHEITLKTYHTQDNLVTENGKFGEHSQIKKPIHIHYYPT